MAQFRTSEQREAIEDLAARWVTWLDAHGDADRSELDRWLRSDPAHIVAFATAQATWKSAARLNGASTLLAPEAAAEPAPHARVHRRTAMGLLAASAVAAIGFGRHWLTAGDEHSTGHGQRASAKLADGSSISLNGDTRIAVNMSDAKREVRFVRGEAMFDVARDVNRPFVIELGDARVRVLGTRFNIRKRDDAIELTVTEGVVSVLTLDDEQARVSAGATALIRPGLLTVTGAAPDLVRQRVAWTQGYLEFAEQPLDQAVAEFNRYRTSPIVIGDPRIASTLVAGRFGVDESEAFVAALSTSFNIKAVTSAKGEVILMQADGLYATQNGPVVD